MDEDTEFPERPGAPQYYEQTAEYHAECARKIIRKSNVLQLHAPKTDTRAQAERDLARLLLHATVSTEKSCEVVCDNDLDTTNIVLELYDCLHRAIHSLGAAVNPIWYAELNEEEFRERR